MKPSTQFLKFLPVGLSIRQKWSYPTVACRFKCLGRRTIRRSSPWTTIPRNFSLADFGNVGHLTFHTGFFWVIVGCLLKKTG